MLPVISDQVGVGRGVPELTEHRHHLATVMCGVVDDMANQLPERRGKVLPAGIPIADVSSNVRLGQRAEKAVALCPCPGPLLAQLVHSRSEEHTSELQSRLHLVCRLLLEKKKNKKDLITAMPSTRSYFPHIAA